MIPISEQSRPPLQAHSPQPTAQSHADHSPSQRSALEPDRGTAPNAERLAPSARPPGPSPFFYGWIIVVVGWICYGFGVSPAYYSWGNFAPAVMAELGFDRADVGGIFGLFTLIYMCMGALVGLTQARVGIRPVMTAGFVLTACGLWLVSRADSALDCYIAYSVMAGAGIGFSTTVPCQTLAQNWFRRRRALVLGIIFTAGGLVGGLVAAADAFLLAHYDWRTGWMVLAAISASLAMVAALFVRDRPEQIGQQRDGYDAPEMLADTELNEQWAPGQALGTPEFGSVILCSIAYAAPWAVLVSHLNLHLQDLGHTPARATALLGLLALVSIVGRLAASVGDRVPPQMVLAAALVLEGLGAGGLLFARTELVAYVCVISVAIGFGAAYISVPVVLSGFFGRRAFPVAAGVSFSVTGVFNGLSPWLTGMIFDSARSYTVPFVAIMLFDLIAALVAWRLRTPQYRSSSALRLRSSCRLRRRLRRAWTKR